MKKILAVLLIIYGVVFYRVLPVQAQRNSPTVIIQPSEIFNGETFKAGGNLIFSGQVNGDLFLVGSQVTFDGQVSGDLFVTGGKVNIEGKIGQNLRAAAGQINLQSTIGRNALIFSGDTTLNENAKINGSLTLFSGNTDNQAQVNLNSLAAGGQFRHNGLFTKNFQFRGDEFFFGPQGKISGNFKYQTPQPIEQITKNQVSGQVEYTKFTQPLKKPTKMENLPYQKIWHLITWPFKVAWLFFGLIFGWLLLQLFPKASLKIVQSLEEKPGKNLLWGLVFMIFVPITIILLILTIVGIALIPIIIMLLVLLHLVARIYAALAVGHYIFKQRRGWALLLGLVLIMLISAIPFLGGLLVSLLYLASTGNLLRLAYLSRKK